MIEINNLTSFPVDKALIKKTVDFVLKKEKCKGNISIAFVNSEDIKILNKNYRDKDKPTDVLSFSLSEKDVLGEVVVAPEQVNGDITYILIHGVLHVLGYNHGEDMYMRQDKYFSLLENKILKR